MLSTSVPIGRGCRSSRGAR